MSDKATWKEQIDNAVEAWRAIRAAFKLGPSSNPPNVYEARRRGKEYCQTEGSDHYILPGVEAMDLIVSLGYAEHFCLASIIKYAARYGEGGNVEDLKKIADYAHILCGVRLAEDEGEGDAP